MHCNFITLTCSQTGAFRLAFCPTEIGTKVIENKKSLKLHGFQFSLFAFCALVFGVSLLLAIVIRFDINHRELVAISAMTCVGILGRKTALILIPNEFGLFGSRCIAWFVSVLTSSVVLIFIRLFIRAIGSNTFNYHLKDLMKDGVLLTALICSVFLSSFVEFIFVCWNWRSKQRCQKQTKGN